MDLSLSEDQRMMVDAARRLVEKHIEPILDRNDKDKGLPKAEVLAVLEKAADLGLTSARIPQAEQTCCWICSLRLGSAFCTARQSARRSRSASQQRV